MTVVATGNMTEADARRLTERIRITAVTFTEAREKLLGLVQEAKEGAAHLALGYQSWTAYLSDTLGSEPMRLARDERQDMVRMLADEGMSTRAIAPIVGVGRDTVRNDILATDRNRSVEDEPPASRAVVGHDGRTRTYSIPTPVDDAEVIEEAPSGRADHVLALINDIRGPWSTGLVRTAKNFTPTERAHIIDALETTLAQLRAL